MPRNDDIEEGAAQGAPRRLGTVPRAALLTPPDAPADLRAALATIPAEWGRRMFDPASLDTRMAACKLTVKHPEDLLVLRQALFDDLCASITWILRTSVLEWEYLSAEQKQQQTEMREAWLSGYSKPSEAILQHWLWKFLKDRTRQFAHLHKVFTNIPSNTPQCGTAAWTQIFFHNPAAPTLRASTPPSPSSATYHICLSPTCSRSSLAWACTFLTLTATRRLTKTSSPSLMKVTS
jgi:hypothetical protein